MRTALTRALRVLAECLGSSTTRRNAAAATKAVPPSAHRSSGIRNAASAVIETLEERALMSTYYVSTTGSDSNNGTSTSSPWKSIAKVSATHLNPGDSVLFQGGKTFSGSLTLYDDGGSSTNRVTISSYGSGDATISSGTANGAWSLNSTGITFDNLIFVGTLGNTADQDGIRIENYSANTVRSGFTVENCTISGYAHGGIDFGADTSTEGLDDVTLNNNNIYNNEEVGIESWAAKPLSNTNITISNNLVHNNYGDGHSTVTGSGIMLQGLNGAMVEYNSAYDNGLKGGNGGVGIWCYSSNDVTFQYNSSVGNEGLQSDDGDGFDFDADTSNSIMQYNYSADNSGAGYLLGQWMNDNDFSNNIVRYNISQDNGRRNNYSGIDIWGKVLNTQIYNNTIYTNPASNGGSSAIRISNTEFTTLYASNIHIANNIFVTTGGCPLVVFQTSAMKGATNIEFTGNVYYSYSGASNFDWGSTTYSSFSSWQSSTGQEKLNGADVGAYTNPQLASAGAASTTALATQLSSVTADYSLLSNTPIVNAGVGLDAILSLATPLTGNSIGKTVPGVDQHLAGEVSTSGSASTPATTTAPAKGIIGLDYFIASDIGNPNKGSNTISGSTNTVTGGGTGVGGTSDSMRFAYTSLTGNGQIVVQVASLSDAQSTAEAGLMIRSSTAANAQSVALMVNNANSATLVNRATSGATSTSSTVSDSGDAWLKMVRIGNIFSSYISANGTTWTLVGSTTVAMSSTVLIGVAVSSKSMSYTETAVFKNVAFSGTIS